MRLLNGLADLYMTFRGLGGQLPSEWATSALSV